MKIKKINEVKQLSICDIDIGDCCEIDGKLYIAIATSRAEKEYLYLETGRCYNICDFIDQKSTKVKEVEAHVEYKTL